jgi:hypothetical protein
MQSGQRITLARGLTTSAFDVNLSRIPAAGRGRIVIEVSDGVRSSETDAAEFSLEPRRPTVHILWPQNDTRLPCGQPVSILGSCLDASGKPCPAADAVWYLDGKLLATGTVIAAVEQPAPGQHRLTLAYGEGEARVERSLTFEVEQPDASYQEWAAVMREA